MVFSIQLPFGCVQKWQEFHLKDILWGLFRWDLSLKISLTPLLDQNLSWPKLGVKIPKFIPKVLAFITFISEQYIILMSEVKTSNALEILVKSDLSAVKPYVRSFPNHKVLNTPKKGLQNKANQDFKGGISWYIKHLVGKIHQKRFTKNLQQIFHKRYQIFGIV